MNVSRGLALDRRGFLKLAGLSWLTPVGQLLADQAERSRQPAQSIILLWLGGGPSQLETFDPHPDTRIAGGTKAIATAVPGIQLAQGFEQLADQMGSVALIRSMVSKEGDHERGTYLMKTGYRPDPTVEHPTIGAICCHELPVGRTDIPRHISILAGQWPARGGFLGGEFDAFQVGDPQGPLPDVHRGVPGPRDEARVHDLESGASLRPRPACPRRGHASSRNARPRPGDDELRAAQGIRRVARACECPRRIWRHPLRPRLPCGPPAHRSRRALRRGHARRMGYSCQQSRVSGSKGENPGSGIRGACCAT